MYATFVVSTSVVLGDHKMALTSCVHFSCGDLHLVTKIKWRLLVMLGIVLPPSVFVLIVKLGIQILYLNRIVRHTTEVVRTSLFIAALFTNWRRLVAYTSVCEIYNYVGKIWQLSRSSVVMKRPVIVADFRDTSGVRRIVFYFMQTFYSLPVIFILRVQSTDVVCSVLLLTG
jgi:hypothetical protein